jgi:hypothetical protein
MGSVHYPRIYFDGYHYWNPNTVNNNDYGGAPKDHGINTYDAAEASPDWQGYLKDVGVDREAFPKWAQTNLAYSADRELPPAEWGYFGGQEAGFVTDTAPQIDDPNFSAPVRKTRTTGYTATDGSYHAAGDPWLGQAIQWGGNGGATPKLVDVNPQSFWSSQIFCDTFTLGTGDTGFSGRVAARMHARFIGTKAHNYNARDDLVIAAGYACLFQTCLPRDSITYAGGGPLQAQFEDAIGRGAQGLMVRFSSYATLYFQGAAFAGLAPGDRYPLLDKMSELYLSYSGQRAEYEAGKLADVPIRPMSRAYSRVVGWIGLWMPGELATVPGGRFLIPYDDAANPGKSSTKVSPSNLPRPLYGPAPEKPDNSDGPAYAPQPLGPATVEVMVGDDDVVERLTVDLAMVVPERDSSGTKCDFGPMKLTLGNPGGSSASSAPAAAAAVWDIAYDQATYERCGGLVDLPGRGLTATQLASDALYVSVESYDGPDGPSQRVPALQETATTAQTDTRGMYAEQPGAPGDGNARSPGPGMPSVAPTCTVHVRYRGYAPEDFPGPAKPTLRLRWSAYDAGLNPINPPDHGPMQVCYRDPSGKWTPLPYAPDQAISVPSDGNVEVQVISKGGPPSDSGGAIPNLVFLPWEQSQGGYAGAPFMSTEGPGGIGSAFYTVVCCLPWHNNLARAFDEWLERDTPQVAEVNDTVFKEVFENYLLAFPAMDFIASPQQFQEWRGRSLALTDPELFDRACYMPVTRTLSAGQRHILVSYIRYLEGALADLKNPKVFSAGVPFARPAADGRVGAADFSGPVRNAGNLGHGG